MLGERFSHYKPLNFFRIRWLGGEVAKVQVARQFLKATDGEIDSNYAAI